MNFIKRLFQPKTKSTIITDPFIIHALTGGQEKVTARMAFEFYRQNSAVATAVDMIAEAIEQIRPVLKDTEGNIEDSSEVLELLTTPNGFETYAEYIGQLSRHYLLKHDSHTVAMGNVRRDPSELYAIKPYLINPMINNMDKYPQQYIVSESVGRGHYTRDQQGKIVRFLDGSMKELYHIMGFSSRSNQVEADSPLEAAALETKQQIEGRVHNLSMLKNGGRLSMVVNFKDDDPGISDDTHRDRRRRVREEYSGSENAGKVAVISGGAIDIKELGKTNRDMDYTNLDKIASNAIYLRYGIPLPLVSLEASTFNNIENAIVFFYEATVLPLYDVLFNNLSKFLLPRYGMDPRKVRLTYNEEMIKPLMTKRLQEIKLRKEINVETIDELRALIPGRDDIPGGDKVYQNATLVPVGQEEAPMDTPDDPTEAMKAFLEEIK